jgi:integrase
MAKRGILTDQLVERAKPQPGGKERIIRDGGVPGLLVRVGPRRKTFGLRIERKGRTAVYKSLGSWPEMSAAAARSAATALVVKFENKEPLDAPQGAATLATTLPRYQKRLRDDDASPWTVQWYDTAIARLSEEAKHADLYTLARNPVIIEDEIARIRRERSDGSRGGASAATATARAVKTLFKFAQKRDPDLRGDPTSAVRTTDKKRDKKDLPILHRTDMVEWWKKVAAIENEVERWALAFTLFSGLRRDSVVKLRWENLKRPVLKSRALHVVAPKGGDERSFDLILSRPMLRVLMKARAAGRRLFGEHAAEWVFPNASGHMRGDRLTKLGVKANHALRRAYASEGRAAGVSKDSIGRLLNHAGKDVTDVYIRNTALGALHLAEQEVISAHLIKALGSPRSLA